MNNYIYDTEKIKKDFPTPDISSLCKNEQKDYL